MEDNQDKESKKWTDITEWLKQTCSGDILLLSNLQNVMIFSEMEVGQFMSKEGFGLLESMSAIEVIKWNNDHYLLKNSN
jgi:hypothetical protein